MANKFEIITDFSKAEVLGSHATTIDRARGAMTGPLSDALHQFDYILEEIDRSSQPRETRFALRESLANWVLQAFEVARSWHDPSWSTTDPIFVSGQARVASNQLNAAVELLAPSDLRAAYGSPIARKIFTFKVKMNSLVHSALHQKFANPAVAYLTQCSGYIDA